MSKVIKSDSPYFDLYDSYEKEKQYTHMLAIPGRVAQAREITQMQSLVKDIIKGVGDSILRDGDIIEGCQVITGSEEVIIDGVPYTRKFARVTEGKVYLNGMVLPVRESKIDIQGIGEEVIGFKLKETIITENEDEKLRDPVQGFPNTNRPGCHRIKSEVEIVIGDSQAATLVKLRDGNVLVERYAATYSGIEQNLARRTYDESGSYIVSGLSVRLEKLSDLDTYNVVVESGKAYILGYEIRIPAPRRISNMKALDTGEVIGRIRVNYEESDSYYLSADYVESIIKVEGPMEGTTTGNGSADLTIPVGMNVEVSGIMKVVDLDTGSTVNSGYKLEPYGVYYRLVWTNTDMAPDRYEVTYEYIGEFGKEDYELVGNDTIRWVEGKNHPITSTSDTRVYFNQYLARNDVVYIDRYGEVSIVQGIPAQRDFESTPTAPVNTLALAIIKNPPNGDPSTLAPSDRRVSVSNIGLTRFTMSDIQLLLNRIRKIEYDQAVNALNDVAKGSDISNKKGIFTDPLIDLSKVHIKYTRQDNDKVRSDSSIDCLSSICYLPTVMNIYDLYKDMINNNRTSTPARIYDRTATIAPSGENIALSQMNATREFLINPYQVFPELPEVSLTPSIDEWEDPNYLEAKIISTEGEPEYIDLPATQVPVYNYSGPRRASEITDEREVKTPIDPPKVEKFGVGEYDEVARTAITYIREKTVQVKGSKFPPYNLNRNCDIICYFDGVPLSLRGINGTAPGASYRGVSTVKADTEGNFFAEFDIPPATFLTGKREVRFETTEQVDNYERSAVAFYHAEGTLVSLQETITEITTITYERQIEQTVTHYVDPIGQTFILDRMTSLKGINLYFSGKPIDGGDPVTCEIREVVNGNITGSVISSCTLAASEVNIDTGSGSIPTRFNFNDHVLLEGGKEYAFVVRSKSTEYKLWVAELGGIDVSSGERVMSNPNHELVGLMMSSSNNSSWTMHQSTDVKFELIEHVYNSTSSEIFYNMVDTESFCRILLRAKSIIPDNTSIEWFYNTGRGYQSISPEDITLLSSLQEQIEVKAVLRRREDTHLSPVLLLDTIGVNLSSYDSNYDSETPQDYGDGGYYVSKLIENLDEYNQVDVILDTSIPGNTNIEVYISYDEDGELIPASHITREDRSMKYGWTERTYRVSLGDVKATKCRVFIKLSSRVDQNSTNYTSVATPAFRRLRAIMYEAINSENN